MRMTKEEALESWDRIFKLYEFLVDKIVEENVDYKEATLRIDRFCIEQLRSVIASYYADLM